MDNDYIIQLITKLDGSKTADDLKKIEQQLNAKGINLKTSLDTATSKQQLQELAKQLQSVLKSSGLEIDTSKIMSAFSQVTKEADKLAQNVNKIQHLSDTGTFAKQVSDATVEYNKLSIVTDDLKTDFAELQRLQTVLGTSQTDEELISNYEAFNTTLEKVKNNMHVLANEQRQAGTYNLGALAEQKKIDSLAESVLKFRDNNTKMSRDLRRQFTGVYDSLINGTNLTEKEVRELSQEFINLKLRVREAGQLGQSFGNKMKNAFQKFSEWGFATGIVTKLWNSAGKLYDEAIKLDGVITDLTMATGANKGQIDSLIDSYSKLGDELKATITDVTISETEWLKQGKSIAEAETLIRDSMILSKVGSLSSADATKYLTSAMKGYNVTAEDTLTIVDKLSAVDMASATDVGGLAEGMSAVAASAQLAGVSMDRLLGYLATVGEVTQDGMASVGTAYNAIFARMGNIKLSRLKDYETGEDLSNVETVLRGVGISLRNSQDEFRNFDEVLDETADRWDSFSGVQQRAIANAFAGTHHVDQFITLMLNYDKALEYTEKSMKSTGQAMEKFAAYEQSVAGHTELFNKSIQDFANTAVDSGLVNFFIDLGTTGVKTLDNIIEGAKELKSLSGTIIGAASGLLMNTKGIGERTAFQW